MPKSWEWLIINRVINVVGSILPRFYIFKRERLKDDYSKLNKSGTCITMENKAWMTNFLFKELILFSNFLF
jgi:hypothetical protein